jgi:hypothetical protein
VVALERRSGHNKGVARFRPRIPNHAKDPTAKLARLHY